MVCYSESLSFGRHRRSIRNNKPVLIRLLDVGKDVLLWEQVCEELSQTTVREGPKDMCTGPLQVNVLPGRKWKHDVE